MSSVSAPAVPTVTLKVNHEGAARRFKLPLRDMSAANFESKVRQYLDIPSDVRCKFERWSDSAGSFIVLDRNNPSVYKQLYRAAKAKAKLKIRITNIELPSQTRAPPAVTVEDEKEDAVPAVVEKQTETKVEKRAQNSILDQQLPERLRIMPLRPRASHPTMDTDRLTQVTRAGLAQDVPPAVPSKVPAVPGVAPGPVSTLDLLTSFDETPLPSTAAQTTSSNVCTSLLSYGDFRVCCNSCEQTIPDVHYHCNKCDDDDFDLCPSCVETGITCYGPDHWLIKRFKKNGVFVSSTTETLPPKAKALKDTPPQRPPKIVESSLATAVEPVYQDEPVYSVRACNSCVRERPEHHFVHCTTCEDYDLCTECFAKDAHGHHPKHAFEPAVPTMQVADHLAAKLSPGRNHSHNAICDKCDKFIRGVRHKCMDCPDWDFCGDCVKLAPSEHAGHRFAPIYEALSEPPRFAYSTVHEGICCDGPLCTSNTNATYISGVRYKCAVCPDTDFCGCCEAHPSNPHNKTHPLIKFKTPVRHALVSTLGYEDNGSEMPVMGDGYDFRQPVAKAPEPTMSSPRPVVSVEPSEPRPAMKQGVVEEAGTKPLVKNMVKESDRNSVKMETPIKAETQPEADIKPEVKEQAVEKREKRLPLPDLHAKFVKDTVADGTVLPQNHVFEQTWVLRNSGMDAWPAGCTVKFAGGDYMGHVNSNHPAGISELVSASESTVCYDALEPGKEYPFTVLLRTPPRDGKVISYWRLTTSEGLRFGDRLWCDVSVESPEAEEEPVKAGDSLSAVESADTADATDSTLEQSTAESSRMVFPKLEKESPVSSMHEARETADVAPGSPLKEAEFVDDLEEWNGSGEDWNGSEDDGFLTDEEYDILDASDQEWADTEKSKATLKK